MMNLMITMHCPLTVKCLGRMRNAKKELDRIADIETEFEPRTSRKGSNGVVHSTTTSCVFRLWVNKIACH